MISKKVISNILSKCYLGNSIESVEWEIREENLYINFMNGPETLVGYVEYRDSIGLKNGNYRIYNTSNLIKCINILDGDILLASDNDYLNIADTNYEIRFSLAESGIIKQAEPIDSNDYNWVASFSINDEFITRFVKSKDALGEDVFTIKTREGFTGEELVFTIGTDITNTVEFIVENATINESFEEIIFDSNLFKEILKANRTYHSGEIRINPKGVLDIHLHCGGPLYTGYILVRNENNN